MRKPGTDAVIITWGTMVRVALEAAQLLESDGLQVGVLDLRWLAPLDEETIRSAATRANGKVVVAHEANVNGGFGAKIVARLHELSENGAPLKIKRVGTPNVRIPVWVTSSVSVHCCVPCGGTRPGRVACAPGTWVSRPAKPRA